jgi:hypothetical protein
MSGRATRDGTGGRRVTRPPVPGYPARPQEAPNG